MKLKFEEGEFGRLLCRLDDGGSDAVATASNAAEAAAEILAAIDSVEANGLGECFWKEAAGEYRWVFRRQGANVRVAVLWTVGVMTGWEHVYWAECPLEELTSAVRAQVPQFTRSAAQTT